LFEQSHSTLYGSPDIDIFPVTYLDYFVFVWSLNFVNDKNRIINAKNIIFINIISINNPIFIVDKI
jgi:hypothetical protein